MIRAGTGGDFATGIMYTDRPVVPEEDFDIEATTTTGETGGDVEECVVVPTKDNASKFAAGHAVGPIVFEGKITGYVGVTALGLLGIVVVKVEVSEVVGARAGKILLEVVCSVWETAVGPQGRLG